MAPDFYERTVRPGYEKWMRRVRVVAWPVLSAGGLSYLFWGILSIEGPWPYVAWVVGFAIGVAGWRIEYRR